jgi:HEPN domain-containing protein
MKKAKTRLKALDLLFAEEAWSDVVREAQEVVELSLKALLRQAGIEPPKWHDVGAFLIEYRDRLEPGTAEHCDELARISAWLRKEREFSFYGDIDFVPTEQYKREDAERALADARSVVDKVARVVTA